MLKNAYKNMLSLFLFTCAPLCIYSDNCQSYEQEVAGYANASCQGVEDPKVDQAFADKLLKLNPSKKHVKLSYYLYTVDFIKSFIEIPTSNVSSSSSTISSKYLAGRAVVYDQHNKKVGTCSASFLCMKNKDGIYTDISNYLSVENGLVISWLTPTTLRNLELDSVIHSMVTECIVPASTKVGFNPFYGKIFNMVVSSDDKKIYFKLKEI
jgi:hypothetical protein